MKLNKNTSSWTWHNIVKCTWRCLFVKFHFWGQSDQQCFSLIIYLLFLNGWYGNQLRVHTIVVVTLNAVLFSGRKVSLITVRKFAFASLPFSARIDHTLHLLYMDQKMFTWTFESMILTFPSNSTPACVIASSVYRVHEHIVLNLWHPNESNVSSKSMLLRGLNETDKVFRRPWIYNHVILN